tara:strand:+ start:225 stop:944 length:720 start_codon:yes stop_codon:yes gene_type:complete
MKKCNNPKCTIEHPLFNKNKTMKDGLSNRCKDCVQKSVKESYLKRRDYYSKVSTISYNKWKKENPKLWDIQRKKWNDKYVENGYFKDYYQKNKERLKIREQQPHIIEKRNKRWRERYKNDLNFRLKEIMKSNFHLFFKDKGETKNLSFSKIVDYTYPQLKVHLEDNFRKGMEWDNFGNLWEIHHITPQSLYDPTDENSVKECWKLDNLLPLWKTTEISHKMGDTSLGNRNVPKNKKYKP